MSSKSFDTRLEQLTCVMVSCQRLARVLGESLAAHWSLSLAHRGTKVVELLRLLLAEPISPVAPLFRGYLLEAGKEVLGTLEGAEAAARTALGEGHKALGLFPALRAVIADAVADHCGDGAPHPSTPPVLNHTHKRKTAKGGR